MPFSFNGILGTLALLLLWRAEELAEACSCAPVHPQQAFCNADVGEYTACPFVVVVVVVFVYLCCTMLLYVWRELAAADSRSNESWMGSQRLLETAAKLGGGGCSSRPWSHCLLCRYAQIVRLRNERCRLLNALLETTEIYLIVIIIRRIIMRNVRDTFPIFFVRSHDW